MTEQAREQIEQHIQIILGYLNRFLDEGLEESLHSEAIKAKDFFTKLNIGELDSDFQNVISITIEGLNEIKYPNQNTEQTLKIRQISHTISSLEEINRLKQEYKKAESAKKETATPETVVPSPQQKVAEKVKDKIGEANAKTFLNWDVKSQEKGIERLSQKPFWGFLANAHAVYIPTIIISNLLTIYALKEKELPLPEDERPKYSQKDRDILVQQYNTKTAEAVKEAKEKAKAEGITEGRNLTTRFDPKESVVLKDDDSLVLPAKFILEKPEAKWDGILKNLADYSALKSLDTYTILTAEANDNNGRIIYIEDETLLQNDDYRQKVIEGLRAITTNTDSDYKNTDKNGLTYSFTVKSNPSGSGIEIKLDQRDEANETVSLGTYTP